MMASLLPWAPVCWRTRARGASAEVRATVCFEYRLGRVAGATAGLEVRHDEPEVWTPADGHAVIDFGRWHGPMPAVGFQLTERRAGKLHEPEAAPGTVVTSLRRGTGAHVGLPLV